MGDVRVIRGQGGLRQQAPGIDHISGLIANGYIAGSLQYDQVYRLGRIEDAIALGIDDQYDFNQPAGAPVIIFEHIKNFFRINPRGVLFLKVVDQATTYEDMASPTEGIATDLLQKADGNINQLALAYNPTAAVTDFTATDAAIAKAQELMTWAENHFMPTVVVLEGKGFALDPSDIRGSFFGVGVVIGQNKVLADVDPTYAEVGLLLGVISLSAVNENVGWVERFNVLGDNLVQPAIGGVAIQNLSPSVLDTYSENHLIFLKTYTGIPGIYFNDSRTAVEVTNDYSSIELNRVYNKASRLIRRALLPSLNGPVNIDTETGQIAEVTVKALEARGNSSLRGMFGKAEISGPDPDSSTPPFTINPEQDVLATSNLEGQLKVTPTGTARNILIYAGFSNPNL